MSLKDMSNCPARLGYLPNDSSGCHCYYTNKGVIDVSAATPYNTTYYKKTNEDCCTGWVRPRDPEVFPKGFPINQRGRWNWSTTNTKMYRPNGLIVPNRIGVVYPTNIKASTQPRQSGNLFPNTHKMSKKRLFSFLSRNRRFLNR